MKNVFLIIKNNIIILVLFLTLMPAIFPLFHSGFPPTHDGEYHVIRFYEFSRSFSIFSVYPRWAPDLNYGYGVPLFNFVYPLPNYLALFFHYLGLSFIDTFKASMILASFIGGVSMYLWAKLFWGKIGGLTSAVVYTYTPYHFVDIYIRGSVGEVWALALFPLLLYLSSKALKEKSLLWQALSSFCLALIILSHNILGLVFFEFYLIYSCFYILIQKSKVANFCRIGVILFLGLSISSIFWLPAIGEKHFVSGLEIYNPIDNFPEIPQLLFPSWGAGFSNSGLQNQMSLQIGVVNLVAILIALFALYKLRKKIKTPGNIFYFMVFFLVSFMVVTFLMTPYSSFIWGVIPFMDYFQFPWRLLSLTMLITSFLAGSIFYNSLISRIKKNVLSFLIIFFSILLTYNYTIPAYYHNRTDSHYTTRSNFIDSTNSPGNLFNTIWFQNVSKRPTSKFFSEGKKVVISKITQNGSNYSFNIKTGKATKVIGNIAFFPGWRYKINNQTKEVKNEKGLVSFVLPKGRYDVEVKFGNTIIRSFALFISLLGVVLVLGMVFYDNISKRMLMDKRRRK